MPVTEKEYKVGSNDGVIRRVFKNIFFNHKFTIIGVIVFYAQKYSIGKECFLLYFLCYLFFFAFIITPENQLCEFTFGNIGLRIIKL